MQAGYNEFDSVRTNRGDTLTKYTSHDIPIMCS
jgi:hypothetical protein